MNQALKKILVPVDYSSLATEALHHAAAIADPATELLVVHVIAKDVAVHRGRLAPALPWHPPMYAAIAQVAPLMSIDLRERADTDLKRYLSRQLPKRSVQRRVEVGRPATEILKVAAQEDVDLIVMGTHDRTGLTRMMLGSVAEQVARHAPCPVLTIKPVKRAASDAHHA